MKRAIYLDDRERDLARRICHWVCLKVEYEMGGRNEVYITTPALVWFHDEIQALKAKFEELEAASPEPDAAKAKEAELA